jgi:hypothetical protein
MTEQERLKLFVDNREHMAFRTPAFFLCELADHVDDDELVAKGHVEILLQYLEGALKGGFTADVIQKIISAYRATEPYTIARGKPLVRTHLYGPEVNHAVTVQRQAAQN